MGKRQPEKLYDACWVETVVPAKVPERLFFRRTVDLDINHADELRLCPLVFEFDERLLYRIADLGIE